MRFKAGDAVKIPRRKAPFYIITCEDTPQGVTCVVAQDMESQVKYIKESDLEPYQQ